jgi:molecular chaperone GrpE (heat shock protein)
VHEQALRNFDLIVQCEKARQLRLNVLLLEEDNTDLHEQLAQHYYRVDELEKSTQELQNQLEMTEAESERLKGELRLKSREIHSLQVRNLSMHIWIVTDNPDRLSWILFKLYQWIQ